MQTEIKVPFFDYSSVFTSEEEWIGLFREVGRRGEITRPYNSRLRGLTDLVVPSPPARAN